MIFSYSCLIYVVPFYSKIQKKTYGVNAPSQFGDKINFDFQQGARNHVPKVPGTPGACIIKLIIAVMYGFP